MQILELAIFAALAGVVLFQLYAVLGRRVGRQPEDAAKASATRPATARREPPRAEASVSTPAADTSGAPNVDQASFLDGAKKAYQVIVEAYAAGDRKALDTLTSPEVRRAFESGIAAREAAGRTERITLVHPPRADLDEAGMATDPGPRRARLRVRFLAEMRTTTREADGREHESDRRTAELWTFERAVDSPDPNWTLTRVDAAPH